MDNQNLQAFYEKLLQEEMELAFPSFSNEDALRLGQIIMEKAKGNPVPLGVEIVLNGLMVFRYYPSGITRDHEMWLARKRKSVELRDSSSLRLTVYFEQCNATFEDWKLNPNEYCTGGGGYPIRIKGSGVIGSVCASGYADRDDHQIIVDAMKQLLEEKNGQ